MDDAYQGILKHHKQSLQNQLEYDERLAKAIFDEHLLPPAALREVEKEINKSKRLLVFLSKLSELRDHSAFRKFISVLERSGYSDIASALRADISKIHFDFQQSKHCTSITDLADHVASNILPRMCSEQDPPVMQALIKEVDDSMNKIRLIEREKSKYMKRLAKIFHIPDSDGSGILGSVNSMNSNDESLEEILYNTIKDKLEADEVEKKKLMESIEKLKKELTLHRVQNDVISRKHVGSEMSQKEDVAYLSQVIRKQDEELLSLRNERRSSQQDFVQIHRKQFEHLVAIMTPYTRHAGNGGGNHNNNNDNDEPDHQLVPDATLDNSAVLHQHVTKLTHTIDNLRDRVSQMTRRIAELEKDRYVIIKSLNKSTKTSTKSSADDKSKTEERFVDYVVDSLGQLRNENADLEAELESLRQRMQLMADEQVTMIQKLATKTTDEQPQQHAHGHAHGHAHEHAHEHAREHAHKSHPEGDDDQPLQPSALSKAMKQRRRGSSTPSVTATPQTFLHHPKSGKSSAKLSVVSSTTSSSSLKRK